MIIHKTPAFDRKFKKLTREQKDDFYTAISLFATDPFDPKLHTHKLHGKWESFHAFRLNYSDRCIFYFIKPDEILLYDIGLHKIYE